jgi:hypothetical protein
VHPLVAELNEEVRARIAAAIYAWSWALRGAPKPGDPRAACRFCVHDPRENSPARNHAWTAVIIGSTRSSEEHPRNSQSTATDDAPGSGRLAPRLVP